MLLRLRGRVGAAYCEYHQHERTRCISQLRHDDLLNWKDSASALLASGGRLKLQADLRSRNAYERDNDRGSSEASGASTIGDPVLRGGRSALAATTHWRMAHV